MLKAHLDLLVMEMEKTVDLEAVAIVLLQAHYLTLNALGLFLIVGHQVNPTPIVRILDFVALMVVLIPVLMDRNQSVIYTL